MKKIIAILLLAISTSASAQVIKIADWNSTSKTPGFALPHIHGCKLDGSLLIYNISFEFKGSKEPRNVNVFVQRENYILAFSKIELASEYSIYQVTVKLDPDKAAYLGARLGNAVFAAENDGSSNSFADSTTCEIQ